MTDNTQTLLLDILKKIQSDLSSLKEGQHVTNQRLGSIDSHMAGFHSTAQWQGDEIISIKERIKRIETRLQILD